MMQAVEDDEIFVYMGGDQVVPNDVRRVRIDRSVKVIRQRAFEHRTHLIDVEFHDDVEIIEEYAFNFCKNLRGPIKLLGVKIIKVAAFKYCFAVTDVEFGNKLETVGERSFKNCLSLTNITIPSVETIECGAFCGCEQLTDLDLPEGLETLQENAFSKCQRLGRISIPLKDDMVGVDVFWRCVFLTAVDLVGRIQDTIASLNLESWRNEMKDEINIINRVLPNTRAARKTAEIQQWIGSVILRIDHYKNEHRILLKEATTLLELALWKAKIDEKEEGCLGEVKAKKAKIDIQSERRYLRITSGASIVIKNVLPFLKLE
mmetsp:Transcript_21907/g.33860  ORF Transcript_21907/g.33860 Transcript_21907/m.33860 type:complete len:318 (-) Transcript_21907:296-1249(-)